MIFPRVFQVIVLLALSSVAAFSQDSGVWQNDVSPLPPPTGFVNDYAGVIDEAARQQLETRITNFKNATGIELAVAVVRTTGDRPIFDYSLAVARGWKIGSKADDNPSALLFVAIDDRKYFTQISRDLEDELPDGVAGSLQRQYLVPEFRKGNYAKGISDTIEAYIAAIEYKLDPSNAPPAGTTREPYKTPVSDYFYRAFCCLATLLFLFSFFGAFRKKGKNDRDRWGGGGGFGGGGGLLPWIVLAGSSGNWGGSSSGGWGGSSGDSGWGGFGGGGDFGGGGAGGDW